MKGIFKSVLFCFLVLPGIYGCVTAGKYRIKADEAQTLSAQLEASRSMLASNQQVIGKMEKDIEEISRNLEQVRQDSSSLISVLEAKKTEKDQLIADLMKAKQDLESKKQQKEREVSQWQADYEVLKEERDRVEKEKEAELARMQKKQEELVEGMKQEIEQGEIQVTQLKDRLSVNIVDKIIFPTGEADVKQEGKKILSRLAGSLKNVPGKQIRIEGHTDNVPIGASLKEKFPTNWELSSARAINVARYLIEPGGLDPQTVSVAGYADTKPIAANSTEEGRARNRRIEIVLIPVDIDRVIVPSSAPARLIHLQ
ncbi:MAG TPA: OmpA family protein [bacterium]|nr:OmpA family protein [bacterium]